MGLEKIREESLKSFEKCKSWRFIKTSSYQLNEKSLCLITRINSRTASNYSSLIKWA